MKEAAELVLLRQKLSELRPPTEPYSFFLFFVYGVDTFLLLFWFWGFGFELYCLKGLAFCRFGFVCSLGC